MAEPIRCEEHNKDFKGPNSRGNYWHFTGMDEEGKPTFCNKPASEATETVYTPKMEKTAQEIREKLEIKPDWDAIAEGKVRHGVAIAFIETGKLLNERTKEEMEEWVKWIMRGA